MTGSSSFIEYLLMVPIKFAGRVYFLVKYSNETNRHNEPRNNIFTHTCHVTRSLEMPRSGTNIDSENFISYLVKFCFDNRNQEFSLEKPF